MDGKILKMIQKHPVFADCPEEDLLAFLDKNASSPVSYKSHEVIYSESVHTEDVGFLLSGAARIYTELATGSALLRQLEPGEIFGVISLFAEEPYHSRIESKGASSVVYLPESALRQFILLNPTVNEHYLTFLSSRVSLLNRKIAYLTAGTPEKKLAQYLYGASLRSQPVTVDCLSLSHLLNIGRASLYRAFSKLESEGLIEKRGKDVYVPSRESLANNYLQ